MKTIVLIAFAVLGIALAGCVPTTVAERDYAYEAWVEQMYEEDINYYLDVISETNEFITYCEKHPEWAE